MQKHFLLLLLSAILPGICNIDAQILIVGDTPGEVATFDGTTAVYDTVYVTGDGTLNISNSTFTVNNLLAADGIATVNVSHSHFSVYGQSLYYGQCNVVLKDSLLFRGNIVTGGYSNLLLDSAYVDFLMSYIGQFEILAFDSASFHISNSDFKLGNGKLGGGIVGKAHFHQEHNIYHGSVGIAMTLGLLNQADFIADDNTGGMELILDYEVNVDITNSNMLVLWFCFNAGSLIDFTFPPDTGSLMTLASYVDEFWFADTVPGVTGIDYHLHLANNDSVTWCLFTNQGSDVTIHNSTLLACAVTYDGTASAMLKGFTNDLTYMYYNAPVADRSIVVENTKVFAWNFYARDSADITIDSCRFGEVLVFDNGHALVKNSLCDGYGGYVGTYQNGRIDIRNSEIMRMWPGPAILLADHNGRITATGSLVTGGIIVNENAGIYFGNTEHDQLPVASQYGHFAEIFTNPVTEAYTDSIVEITGTVDETGGPLSSNHITSYRIEWSLPDTTMMTGIADSSITGLIYDDQLCNWNTAGMGAGTYLLWGILYVDGSPVVTAERSLWMDDNTIRGAWPDQEGIKMYPNPVAGTVNIIADGMERIDIMDMQGKVVYSQQKKCDRLRLDVCRLKGGIYLLKVVAEENNMVRKVIIL